MNMPTYTELQDKVNALEKKIVTLEQTDQELHDLTDKYWQLFNHSGALVIVVDTDGIIINLNDAAAINIGSARGAVIGKTLHELFP